MANELQYRHDESGVNLYAVIVNADPACADFGEYWNADGAAFEVCTVANWAQYDIVLTETPASSYRYVGTFPAAIPPGVYDVLIFVRGGASPDVDDWLAASGTAIWTSEALQPPEKTMEAVLAVVAGVSTFNESTGVATFKKQDGATTAVSVTISGAGVRSGSDIA